MNTSLVIDPEFEAICPALTDEEYELLEENIVSEGIVLMPLIIWDDTIVDGHNRYKIANAHPGIEFRTYEKQFSNRYAALAWICKNQLGRRNLTPQDKEYLIGKRYDAEKMAHGGDRKSRKAKSSDQIGHLNSSLKTRKKIANETKTSEGYVERAGQFARGVDAAEEVLPGIKREILSGAISPKKPDVAAVAKAPPEKRRQMAEALRFKPDKGNDKAGSDSSAPNKYTKMSQQELKEVRDVCAEMTDDSEPPTGEDSILETLHGTVTEMIRVCDTLFTDFPRLLSDRAYKARVIAIMQVWSVDKYRHTVWLCNGKYGTKKAPHFQFLDRIRQFDVPVLCFFLTLYHEANRDRVSEFGRDFRYLHFYVLLLDFVQVPYLWLTAYPIPVKKQAPKKKKAALFTRK